MEKIKYISTGIASLDALLDKKGFTKGDWIGLIGEPGTMKTVLCLTMVKKWLYAKEGNCAIVVTTETDAKSIKRQMYSLKFDEKEMDEFINDYKQLAFVDVFSKGGVDTRPSSIITAVQSHTVKMRECGGEILLIIDSMAPLWNKAAVMSRDIYSQLITALRYQVDLAITTLQVSTTTGKSFGFGAEHNADDLIRVWLLDEMGDQKIALKVLKTRGQSHDGKWRYLSIDNDTKEMTVEGGFTIKGRFKSADEALDSLKYTNAQEIQETRNIILSKQLKELNENVAKLIDTFPEKKK